MLKTLVYNIERFLASKHEFVDLPPVPDPVPLDRSDEPSSRVLAHLAEAMSDVAGGEEERHRQIGIQQMEDLANRARLVLCQVLQQMVRKDVLNEMSPSSSFLCPTNI